ncbi:AAA family ATPase [Actinomadura harenae]|uniref:ATP-binding protein n=1 Tax=Actinomadura harenae TaxID=2483351 RepID=A0A3M2LYN3_9ACTN|nr:ATP-binding protein [Actinomadura harenae]RMI41185.1 ATP-binding protein [Actinomadura harenae]
MLLSFRAANHRSIRSEQQLLLTPSYASDLPDATPRPALPVVGIFGPNASGKSNVFDAFRFAQAMVIGSFRESEPDEGVRRYPFAGADGSPSSYVTDLSIDGDHFTYGFSVDDGGVVEEWMYSYPRGRERTLFHRRRADYRYGEKTPQSLKDIEQFTEPNVLFISVAARARQESVRPVYDWFALTDFRDQSTGGIRRYRLFQERVLRRAGYLDRLSVLLRAADTGIEQAEILEEGDGEYQARMARLEAGVQGGLSKERRRVLSLRHRSEDGTFSLSVDEESAGTKALLDLSLPAFASLDRGTLLMVDELDASLHPFLSAQLIRLFQDPETNPRGAQLVFTSHDASLLGRIQGAEVLHRDQIWFTQKDDSGETELFPLSEFRPRKDENRERRYLAGRYGAVPVVNDELFVAALAAREDPPNVSKSSEAQRIQARERSRVQDHGPAPSSKRFEGRAP